MFGGTLQLDFIRNCRQQLPDARIVIFTSLDADVIAQMCLQAGADSILQKEREIADLVAEVMRLVSGARSPRADASEAAESHALAQLDLPKLLTAREREIAQLLGQGATIAQISTSLGISKKTAAVHSDNIRRKIGCANSRQMVTFLAKVGGLGVA